ncbi:MAG TPA: GAF domain-containing protein [Coleofasciculaceae cyanobacterium]
MTRLFSVHPRYIQQVNLAWKLKSEGREHHLAGELGRSLPIVISNLFLKGEPVNRVNFIEICQILGLNWREIAGLDMQDKHIPPPLIDVNASRVLTQPSSSVKASDVDEAINSLVGTLCEMLRRLTRKAGDLLGADRTSIFLLDQQTDELGSVVAEDGDGGCLLIDIPANRGIAGLAATTLEIINIPFDVYDDPRSEEAQKTDKKTGYRTYTMLAWPLLDKQKDLIAVVQLINKLKPNHNPKDDLLDRIDKNGFTKSDEAVVAKFAPSILKILQECQSCYQLSVKLKTSSQFKRTSLGEYETGILAELKGREQKLRKSLEKL